MFLSEWREFPSAPCLARKKKNLMTARVSTWLKLRASLTCFRVCFFPGRAKDLSALRYAVLELCLGTKTTLPSAAIGKHGLPSPSPWSLSRLHHHIELSTSHSVATPLDKWSARSTDPYLTTHNTIRRLAAMHAAGFEPAIPASEQTERPLGSAIPFASILLHRHNCFALKISPLIRCTTFWLKASWVLTQRHRSLIPLIKIIVY